MSTPPTPFEQILEQACAFAELHNVEGLTTADFAIQRSPAGETHATHVRPDVVVVVIVRRGEDPVFALADPDWIHYPDPGAAECDLCEPDEPPDPPMVDVYLPGDAPTGPAEAAEGVEIAGGPPWVFGRDYEFDPAGPVGWEDLAGVVHVETDGSRDHDPVNRAAAAIDGARISWGAVIGTDGPRE